MNKSEEYYDKDAIRTKRQKSKEHKRDKTNEGKNFNRRRARQNDSEQSRIEEYFY